LSEKHLSLGLVWREGKEEAGCRGEEEKKKGVLPVEYVVWWW
jgi:hypothetical protein